MNINPQLDSLETRELMAGLPPAQIREFYGLDRVYHHRDPATEGAGVSIAIVVPYDDPTLQRDVDMYFDRPYHLPDVNLSVEDLGIPGNEPDIAWSMEEESDVEMVQAVAPLAHIIVVEAIYDDLGVLLEADRYAASLPGVVAVDNSWGTPEFTGEDQLDSYLASPGVTFVAAAGDTQAPDYPAASPNVIAVGGVLVDGDRDYVWPLSGGGASPVYPGRTTPDLVMAMNSTQLMGTSVSSALFTGLVGIADSERIEHGLVALDAEETRSLMDSARGNGHVFRRVIGHAEWVGLGSPRAPGLIKLLSS